MPTINDIDRRTLKVQLHGHALGRNLKIGMPMNMGPLLGAMRLRANQPERGDKDNRSHERLKITPVHHWYPLLC
jgi:hypothetical protein